MDTCGTGGDASGTFNISTATAFVVAGAGVRVAKHGNRSLSSKCGSADVMEALGVKISLPSRCPGRLSRRSRHRVSVRARHALRHEICAARAPRASLAHHLQSARPAHQSGACFGAGGRRVFRSIWWKSWLRRSACWALHRALVVHGLDGLDEITITGPTRIAEVRDGNVRTYEVTPEEFGIKRARLEDISGGDADSQRRHHS